MVGAIWRENLADTVQIYFVQSSRTKWLLDLGTKRVRLSPHGTNPGLFNIRFQYILQNVLKSDLKKFEIFPIWG